MALSRSLFRLSTISSRVSRGKSLDLARIVQCSSATYCLQLQRYTRRLGVTSTSIYRYIHDDRSKIEAKKQIQEEQRVDVSNSIDKDKSDVKEGEQTLTQVKRLKKVFAEYGSTAVIFHVCISLTSLGICYGAVTSGLDVPSILHKIGLSERFADSSVTTGASTFVIAYACHKVFVPLRMFLTITCTPLIVRRLRIIGFLKAPVKPSQ